MISIPYEKITLDNGLDLILHKDNSIPFISINTWFHVGSKNEKPGQTGFAHLFEHIMFEGSKNHNKSFFKPLQEIGASLNGSTSSDRTNYWENIPSNYLELVLWLESDRMGFLLEALDQKRFDIQRDVVKNERRENYENQPYGMAHLILQSKLFPNPHPYNWPTIGYMEDLDSANLSDVKNFFNSYYHPSNASLAIAGDIDIKQTIKLVEKYYGSIPPGNSVNKTKQIDSQLKGNVRLSIKDKVSLPRLYIAWPTVADFALYQPELELLSIILGHGKTSRLYKKLVYETQIAKDVNVYQYSQEIAGEFIIEVTANKNQTLLEIETLIEAELKLIQEKPIGYDEILKAKNIIKTQFIRQLEKCGGFGGKADQLNYYNIMSNDTSKINSDLDRYMNVTAPSMYQAIVNNLNSNSVRLSILPEKNLKYEKSNIDRSVKPKSNNPTNFETTVPKSIKLDNELKILHIQKSNLPIIEIGLIFDTGTIDDPENTPGLSYISALMLNEGTANFSSQEIAYQLESLGSQLSIEIGKESIEILANSTKENYAKTIQILADIIQYSTYPQHEIDRLIAETTVDLNRIQDNPSIIASRGIQSLLYGIETPYGHPIKGFKKTIKSITQMDIEEHCNKFIKPSNATLIIVGDINHEEVFKSINTYFGNWKAKTNNKLPILKPNVPANSKSKIYIIDKPGAAQSLIRTGHLTIPRNHKEYLPLSFNNYLFGGHFAARLNMNLRQDKGYTYGFSSTIQWAKINSPFISGGSVDTPVTKESIIEIIKEYTELTKSNPVSKKEFNITKQSILRNLPNQFETLRQIIRQISNITLFNLDLNYYSKLPDEVNNLSIEEVIEVGEKRILSDQIKLLIVGDYEKISSGINNLGLPVEKIDYNGNPI
ncbi:MAG: insulinase family protein [SAR202 cluster bacterium]|nr:insulinase family protein [SAR202 cluster bacterium]